MDVDFDIEKNLSELPDTPGVYLHRDSLGDVIYVGKAISLRKRVRSYFRNTEKQALKVQKMVSQIAWFEYINCETEMEALILECNLIKKYRPKYNVLLRDDKTYPYIEVTLNEYFPRIIKTRELGHPGSKYFGPYSSAGAVNEIVDMLNDVYSLKRCNAIDFPDMHRPCLNYYINVCGGVCEGRVVKSKYMEGIDEAISFLSGNSKKLLKNINAQMKKASDRLDFESAAKYRNYMIAAESILDTQRATRAGKDDFDIILIKSIEGDSFAIIFFVRDGKLAGREQIAIEANGEKLEAKLMGEFIKQYYSKWAKVPHKIAVAKLPEEKELLESYLGKDGRKVTIYVPERGFAKKMLELSERDAQKTEKSILARKKAVIGQRKRLKDAVHYVMMRAGYEFEPGTGFYKIERNEYRIESYDISNTNGIDSVGAMVVFEGNKPVRKDYRRFKVKTVEGPNDIASLTEVISRRFTRGISGDPAFYNLPDCIFMDGGIAQVHACKSVLNELRIDIPVVGMAKNEHHRTRAIVFDNGDEIDLKDYPILFRYAGRIQEEVHRFAIEYHRKLRGKRGFNSILDEIEGIGPKRRNALLAEFGSIEKIREASEEELRKVKTMNQKSINSVLAFFKNYTDKEG